MNYFESNSSRERWGSSQALQRLKREQTCLVIPRSHAQLSGARVSVASATLRPTGDVDELTSTSRQITGKPTNKKKDWEEALRPDSEGCAIVLRQIKGYVTRV